MMNKYPPITDHEFVAIPMSERVSPGAQPTPITDPTNLWYQAFQQNADLTAVPTSGGWLAMIGLSSQVGFLIGPFPDKATWGRYDVYTKIAGNPEVGVATYAGSYTVGY